MRLTGRSILLCEDEPLIALDLEGALASEGATVIGPATHRKQAHELLTSVMPDAAVLDIVLLDGDCTDVAEVLASKGIPIAVVSVLSRPENLPPHFANAKWFTKPFSTDEIMDFLATATVERLSV